MAEKMQEIDLSLPSNITKAPKLNQVPERTLRWLTFTNRSGENMVEKHHKD